MPKSLPWLRWSRCPLARGWPWSARSDEASLKQRPNAAFSEGGADA